MVLVMVVRFCSDSVVGLIIIMVCVVVVSVLWVRLLRDGE